MDIFSVYAESKKFTLDVLFRVLRMDLEYLE